MAFDNRVGFDVASGQLVEVRYDRVISAVDTLIDPVPGAPLLAPAWIDVQVNGYAGVDYNDPQTPVEEIARSVAVLHSTGTGRFFPTVITGTH